ncbi:TRAP transporter substrate-binding protein [Antarcticibacterium sp. 1MA-6-2]|uniref:TRAP transporter substrate-binding protein n=1 Tax=Antarcticibacterium sp. 1MA-6-2 TaxID=2908210 RepID=UPI001F3340AF|nr:TRAP transporter substrate-binding protein [Antarcticibacterium sp. 1MA-6-2]UJH90655.1 TRAP transporter substrate-binding protein [Antarcticibacterium sp. 1MA-6-2]
MKKRLTLIFLVLSCFSCQKENETKFLKLGHSLGLSHPVHIAMEFFAKRVREKSGGKLIIEIYPSGQLGGERESLELLQIGSLAMTKVSSAVMENFSPKLQVFGYPYLFRDKEHRYQLYDSELGQELLAEGKQYWLKGLTYFDAGSRSFYTKNTKITRPENLEGLKIRVMESPTAINLVKTLGGSPTPVSWGELYTSLQQGVVDGAENNLPSFYSSRHYEIAKEFSVDEHTSIPDILVISTLIYDSLTTDEQKWLQESAREAAIKQRELWEEAETEALKEITAAGVNITYPNKGLFREKSLVLIEDLKTRDKALYQLVQEIKELN